MRRGKVGEKREKSLGWARTRARARPGSWPAKGGSRKQQPPPDRRYRAPRPPLRPLLARRRPCAPSPQASTGARFLLSRPTPARCLPRAPSSVSPSSSLYRPQARPAELRAYPAAGVGETCGSPHTVTRLVRRQALRGVASFLSTEVTPLRPARDGVLIS